jgi:hypothetical protein
MGCYYNKSLHLLVEWLNGRTPEFKPQYCQNKKKGHDCLAGGMSGPNYIPNGCQVTAGENGPEPRTYTKWRQ